MCGLRNGLFSLCSVQSGHTGFLSETDPLRQYSANGTETVVCLVRHDGNYLLTCFIIYPFLNNPI